MGIAVNRSEFLSSLSDVLQRAVEVDDAGFGNVQRLAPGRANLEIVAQHGFSSPFLDFFKFVSVLDDSACGRAYRLKARVVVQDVLTDPHFAPFADVAIEAGFRAVQSTPIVGLHGDVLGVLSTHFRQPHRLTREAIGKLDACAREAATIMQAYDGNGHDGHDRHAYGEASGRDPGY